MTEHTTPKISVGIVGGTGYTGLELCRLLSIHPHVTITHVYSQASAGQTVGEIYPHLTGLKTLTYHAFDPSDLAPSLDVLFLALPHAKTHAIMPQLLQTARQNHTKVIDLSADFRLSDATLFESYYETTHESPELLTQIPYGLPEKYRAAIGQVDCVATPGCYATAVILGLLPLAKAGKLTDTVIVDAKSGVSGAGKGLKGNLMYCEANEHFSTYGTGTHRHTAEMEKETGSTVFFSPHLVPMSRGILASMYIKNTQGLSQEAVDTLYQNATKGEPFLTYHSRASLSTQLVTGSNNCHLSAMVQGDQIVVFSCIDNLIKGAAGQAIQCMNLMMDWDETIGLGTLIPLYL